MSRLPCILPLLLLCLSVVACSDSSLPGETETPTESFGPIGESPTSESPTSSESLETSTPASTTPPSSSPSPSLSPSEETSTPTQITPSPTETAPTDYDWDGYPTSEDCDDEAPYTYPGAPETCDQVDEDCDGDTDEGLILIRSYADGDGDGHGEPSTAFDACYRPEGYVASSRDCDDADGGTYPGALEVCDGRDNDCDDRIDEGAGDTYYLDGDGDGWGEDGDTAQGCQLPEGFVDQGGDCDDGLASVYPGADEVCNQVDEDCDGTVDEGTTQTVFADLDGDGYGDPSTSILSCQLSEGFVLNGDDCDDTFEDAYPEGIEGCDDRDNDCDGNIDEGLFSTWYQDADGDGYGDLGTENHTCAPSPDQVQSAGDCDDDDDAVSPEGIEGCDSKDNDCDGNIDEGVGQTYHPDYDGDGYGDMDTTIQSCSPPPQHIINDQDCDDGNATIKPGAIEGCEDAVDQDCSGLIDGKDPSCEIAGYAFAGEPDCGSRCYYDEAHNIATNGAADNNAGYNTYALGQLTDGARGVDDYTADLGNGRAYEWVAWSNEDAQVYVRFGAERVIENITLGINNRAAGGVGMPSEIQVFLSHDYNSAPYDVAVFRSDLGTLPDIPQGERGDIVLDIGGRSAAQIRIYCFRGAGWTFLDEIEVR